MKTPVVRPTQDPRIHLIVALVAALLLPQAGSAQDVMSRTPNLSGTWVGTPGVQAFNVDHRFWSVPTQEGRAVLNSPTMLFGIPVPGRILVAGRFATRSPAGSADRNEWELLGRWSPDLGRLEAALTGAYNGSAESVDGELSLGLSTDFSSVRPGSGIRVIVAARALGDALGSGETGWFGGGGIVLSVGPRLALSGDVGTLEVDGLDTRTVWGAGVQMRIPGSPHTVALFASNALTGTLQGTSFGGRTVWGFEFTVPVRAANLLP